MNTIFSISVVSHGHRDFVLSLIQDLINLNRPDIEVILTINIPEGFSMDLESLPFKIKVINNSAPKGFAANHNFAFFASRGKYFVILNPDIRILNDPFETIHALLDKNPRSICAPTIVNEIGKMEDSFRNFPSPFTLLVKAIAKICKFSLSRDIIPAKENVFLPDWVAGMFVVIPREIYKDLNGLSESFYMYYEDVDFCARAKLSGYFVMVSMNSSVIHNARRDSHRKIRFLIWHLRSAAQFFFSSVYIRIRMRKILKL